MQKGKWLSEKALQITEKRREVKGKGEKEKYTHLNEEFQRIAKRDKKVFLSEKCKEIEENNRMGKTKAFFKKIKAIKGLFHSKIVTINDRNSTDITEAEDINQRWQEYTEELKKKKKKIMTQITKWCEQSPRDRHPGVWSQKGLRKHHYEQS